MDKKHYQALNELEETHWWHLSRQKIIPEFLQRGLRQFGYGREAKLLDVGCGTGRMLAKMARFTDAAGIDMSPLAVREARKKTSAKIILGQGEHLPFADESFEVVSAQEVIEHIKAEHAALVEWKRVLKPGGLLLLTVPAMPWMWGLADVFAQHQRRYTKRSLRRALKSAGFEVVRASYFNFFLFPIVAAVRLLRKPLLARAQTMTEDERMNSFDFYIGPSWLNKVLEWIFSAERYLLRAADLPWGVSIIALARRQPDDELKKNATRR